VDQAVKGVAFVLMLAFGDEPPTPLPWTGTLHECRLAADLYVNDPDSTESVRQARRASCLIADRKRT
jgi:hypothetical protein